MHMADALISPAVGGVFWAATAGVAAYSVRKLQKEMPETESKIPLMGVAGAFVFAAQMINLSIPGTGSSGHIGGGMLLAALLGPHAGFLTMAVILAIQALFFADGGLLALGCNIFNLAFFTCYVAYPLIYQPLIKKGAGRARIVTASLLSAIAGLQMGAFSVVVQTVLSGVTDLPFGAFVLMMQPIHLAIGVLEGLIMAAVLVFVQGAAPQMITPQSPALKSGSIKRVIAVIAVLALVTGGVLSWFASTHPDGLEWAILNVAGVEEFETPEGIHQTLENAQEKSAFLPDYGFKSAGDEDHAEGDVAWPNVDAGTSISGIVGGILTLGITGAIGGIIMLSKRRRQRTAA